MNYLEAVEDALVTGGILAAVLEAFRRFGEFKADPRNRGRFVRERGSCPEMM